MLRQYLAAAVDEQRDANARLVHYPKEMGFLETLLEERGSLLAATFENWVLGRQLPRDATWSLLDLRPLN